MKLSPLTCGVYANSGYLVSELELNCSTPSWCPRISYRLENDIYFYLTGEIRLLLLHFGPRGHPLGSCVQSGIVRLFRRIFTLFPGGETGTYSPSWTQWRDDVTPTKERIIECPSVIQVL